MNKSVAIIGAGRVGSSVGYLLKEAGFTIAAVVARTMQSAEQAALFIGAGDPMLDAIQATGRAELVFITTPDRSIREVSSLLAASRAFKPGALVVHMSGAHSLDLLDAARTAGARRAVLHPLQSLASREQGIKTLPDSYFRIEADQDAAEEARVIVSALGGIELAMPQWKSDKDSAALYHAGAVAVSNYVVALVDYGLKFYEALGADKQEALQAVLPLIHGTLQNIETLGIPGALTGPIMRGDVQTVRDHLDAMARRTPELIALYQGLARQTVALAREKKSISPEVAAELLKLVNKP
jgi:predicted short-subunit dehydrogenase-like oxidoreductase (DUF2520 family)